MAEIEGNLGAALPGYEIGTELGRGAFGVALAGRHRQLGRDVAIKQLSPGLVGNDVGRTRFLSEAQVLASIDHPHIVPVYDYVEHDDACIVVIERLAGGTGRRCSSSPVQPGFAVGYLTPAPNEDEFDGYNDEVLLAQIVVVDDPLDDENANGTPGVVTPASPAVPDGRATAAP